jgi:hypothetical protein
LWRYARGAGWLLLPMLLSYADNRTPVARSADIES